MSFLHIFATEILILIITDIYLSCYSKPKDMRHPPTFSKNWIFVLFCLCGVGLSACQSNSLADISGAGRIGSAPVRCRHPGSQRCLPKVDLPFRVCGPDPRRARKGRGIQCNAFGFCEENLAMCRRTWLSPAVLSGKYGK